MAATSKPTLTTLQVLRQRRRSILAGLLMVGLAYAAIPQLGFFDTNWATLLRSDWRFFAAAVVSLLFSFAAASTIYMHLAPMPLRFGSTYLVQIASAFAGKVLPVGLGSIGINYLYLRRQGCRQTVAATVVAVNNLLGFAGHGLWLLLVVALLSHQVQGLNLSNAVNSWVVLGLALGMIVLVAIIIGLRKRLRRAIKDVLMQLGSYRRQPTKLLTALGASMILTACNIAIVWFSAQALDVPLSMVAATVALTTGILAQTVTPTPGGLGGVEAGLVGGLVICGMTLESAVAVTILFRFVNYWLPLAFGGLALWAAIRRKLL